MCVDIWIERLFKVVGCVCNLCVGFCLGIFWSWFGEGFVGWGFVCFEELWRDILSFSNGDERDYGKMGLYVDVVMIYGIRGENYIEL